MSKKNIKVHQPHKILKGANTSRVLGYSRLFHLIMKSQQIPSSNKAVTKRERDIEMIVII